MGALGSRQAAAAEHADVAAAHAYRYPPPTGIFIHYSIIVQWPALVQTGSTNRFQVYVLINIKCKAMWTFSTKGQRRFVEFVYYQNIQYT